MFIIDSYQHPCRLDGMLECILEKKMLDKYPEGVYSLDERRIYLYGVFFVKYKVESIAASVCKIFLRGEKAGDTGKKWQRTDAVNRKDRIRMMEEKKKEKERGKDKKKETIETEEIKEEKIQVRQEMENGQCCIHTKSTPRREDELRQMKNRLSRMAGQLSGIGKMLDENRYCGDILIQVAAVESALQSFGYLILKEHMETCVAEEIGKGNRAVLDEVVELIKKLK